MEKSKGPLPRLKIKRRRRGAPGLWKLCLRTTTAGEAVLSEWLGNRFRAEPASFTDAETGAVTVAIYLSRKPSWGKSARAGLRRDWLHIRQCGLDLGSGRFSLSRIHSQDWSESWKLHFRPLKFGSDLLIKPSWNRMRAQAGQRVIVIDPGLSFGTGQHPTTGFCLKQIVARRSSEKALAFLDLGTGSGILAIAAARLGYKPVRASDIDPDAVRIARSNARANGLERKILFEKADVADLPSRPKQKFSLVCANLTADLLVGQVTRIRAQLAKDGVLVLAGILKKEFSNVRRAYEKAGLRLMVSKSEGEWQSGAFRLQSADGRQNPV